MSLELVKDSTESEISEIVKMCQASIKIAESIIIEHNESAEIAKKLGKEITAAEKSAADILKRKTQPLKDEISEIKNMADELLKPLSHAKEILRARLTKWQIAERKRQAEIEAIERKARQEAILAAARKKAPMPEPAPVMTKAAEKPVVSTQKRWTFEIEDEAALPRKYLMPNRVLIGQHIRSGVSRKIKGVRVWQEETASFR